ncbi:bifunctional riboflavin kinase/FAD synthetase [Phenylobacterium aquaticum]|uniref:bifunctional riboflavin kinase/FAD synthetase n=1 Tax=Phenylobacterium aquaticum TaxID=1763816 RepID=UPI0026F340E4|nr:bifunctional riboflavin kinase/FAD synthetase [Phenylobacterium aquaticum]
MRIVEGWKGLAEANKGASVALGNFDGVHRGHQRVIAAAARAAQATKAPLGVISFEPHPRRIFQPDAPAFRLMNADQQTRALADLGVDLFYVLPFDAEMANLTDREFAELVLHQGLGVRHVAVGFDISFGKGRTGSPVTMTTYGAEFGFSVSVAEAAGEGGAKFSSTAVREALRNGRPETAAAVLGRPFAIQGMVEHGRQLGRQLGFPTANVDLADYVVPRFGVYATRTRLPDGREIAGVANLGVNPTVTGTIAPRLEVWLFDFDEDIYDQVIETDLIAFLRDEEKFVNLEVMTEQVMADARRARALLLPDF